MKLGPDSAKRIARIEIISTGHQFDYLVHFAHANLMEGILVYRHWYFRGPSPARISGSSARAGRRDAAWAGKPGEDICDAEM